MVRLYGIPNCDTMKKARQWLSDHGIEYEFSGYKKSGVDEKRLRQWVKQVGWETLLNRRGTTWRKLDEGVRLQINESNAIRLMQETPSIIKRPVLERGKTLQVGFKADEYAAIFNANDG